MFNQRFLRLGTGSSQRNPWGRVKLISRTEYAEAEPKNPSLQSQLERHR
jgi:hypothetical protein